MKFKSEHMTQASGSIAGVTYARAKGGTLYRRSRAIPVNPATMYQQQIRDSLTHWVNMWTETLSDAVREAWNTYGANVPVTNALGDSITLSGQNWYIACNSPRMQADDKLSSSLGGITNAPTIFDRGDFTTPGVTVSDASIDLAFDDGDAWANAVGGAMFLYMGKPRNSSRNFFKGPYRLIEVIEGAATPPTSPATVTSAQCAARGFPLIADQRITLQVAVTQPDGRLSTRRTIYDAAIAAE